MKNETALLVYIGGIITGIVMAYSGVIERLVGNGIVR